MPDPMSRLIGNVRPADFGCVNAEASQTDENKENNVKKACVHRIDSD